VVQILSQSKERRRNFGLFSFPLIFQKIAGELQYALFPNVIEKKGKPLYSHLTVWCYYNKLLETGYFMKKRDLLSSQFWRTKSVFLALLLVRSS
jgi:hypothetical protein